MKTYEEMARDVLRRRDEALQKTEQQDGTSKYGEVFYPVPNKKRRLLSAIAVPCAAALAIGAVAVGTRYAGLWGKTATESETSSAGHVDAEDLFLSSDPNTESELTEKFGDMNWKLIRILDEVPEYLADHRFFSPQPFTVSPVEYIPFTAEEMNNYYGIEFDRLRKFHNEWDVVYTGIDSFDDIFTGNYGVLVYDGDDESVIESDERINGKKVVSSYCEEIYGVNGGEVRVEAVRIGVGTQNVFSPFDPSVYKGVFSPDNFSVIGDYNAIIYRSKGVNDVERTEAIIEMGDTLVRITADGAFWDVMLVICEFTAPDISDDKPTETVRDDLINILDDVPEHYQDPPRIDSSITNNNVDIWLTYEEASSWFGVDLGRLGRLHEDWEVVSNFAETPAYCFMDDEPYSGNGGDYTIGGYKILEENSAVLYNFKDGGCDYESYREDRKKYAHDVCVQLEHIGINSDFDPFDSCPDRNIISYVNGKEALLYHVVDESNNALRADIKYGQTIVTISTYDLTEDEFIKIVDEFTSPEYDIEITPLEEFPHDKFAEIIPKRKKMIDDMRERVREMNEQNGIYTE